MPETIRDLQLLGTMCFGAFCKRFSLVHRCISEFLDNKMSFLLCANLAAFEDELQSIELNGVYEGIPAVLEKVVPEHLKEDFESMVELVTEISRIDLFAANSEWPSVFLQRCFVILERYSIKPPCGPVAIRIREWGKPYSKEEFSAGVARFRRYVEKIEAA